VGLEFWANVSVVWLSFLCFIGIMIPLAATYFAIRGMHVVLGRARSFMGIAQRYSGMIRSKTDSLSTQVAKPIITAESKAAQADEVIRSLADDTSR